LLEHFWWGSVFLLGIPVMLVLLVAAPLLLPEYRDPYPGHLDLPSVALSLATILPTIYGLKEIARDGLHPLPVLAMLFGLAMGVVFLRRQLRLPTPLVDVRLFTNRGFSAALGGMFGVTLTGANMLFITQHLQYVDALSPLHAGLWMLPGVFASMAGFLLSPVLARRIRPAYLIGPGLLVSACGGLLLTQVGTTSSTLPPLVLGFALFNAGAAPLVSLATGLVMGAVPPEKAGAAGALVETSGELAFALGIATLGSLGAAVYRSTLDQLLPGDLPPMVSDAARDTLAGATAVAAAWPEPLGSVVLAASRSAFVSGMQTVAAVTVVVFVGLAIVELIMLRHVPPIGARATVEPAAHEASGTPNAVYAA
jgi:DHA2 family multidrug resistance protein-like MFS transporter